MPGEGIGGGVLLSMAVRRSLARLVSSRVGVFAWLALCWCWRRWRGGAWPMPGWRCWRSASCLAHGWAGAFAWLAGVGAGAVYRLAAPACAGPVCSAAGQLSQQAHTAHAATAGPGSGEGLPIMPPRPGSAIAGRPAENGHGPPPRVFTAPGLVSW